MQDKDKDKDKEETQLTSKEQLSGDYNRAVHMLNLTDEQIEMLIKIGKQKNFDSQTAFQAVWELAEQYENRKREQDPNTPLTHRMAAVNIPGPDGLLNGITNTRLTPLRGKDKESVSEIMKNTDVILFSNNRVVDPNLADVNRYKPTSNRTYYEMAKEQAAKEMPI